ncbi:MAG: GGDEF domain-containing protein, partial [Bacilli bacterium]
LEFNRLPYLKESVPTTNNYRIRLLNNEENLTEKDLLIFEDGYVAIGKKYNKINQISEIKDQTLGVFTSDVGELSYYLKSGSNLTYKTYESINSLYDALDKDEVGMIIVPNVLYLDKLLTTNYTINYYFTEMSKKVVFTLSDNNQKLNEIVKKYYQHWKKENYVDEYNEAYLNYYVQVNNINAKTKADLLSKNYVYGYVENTPYEVDIDNKPYGIASEYVNRMARLTGIDFTYKKYKSYDALKKAIANSEVDLYFDCYNLTNDNYSSTISTFVEDYVVLGKEKDNYIVRSFESLKGSKVAMVSNNALYDYISSNSRASISTYKNVDELLKKADNKLIVVDKEIYTYFATSKFAEYKVLYNDTMTNDYRFMVKKTDETFYKLFNYIIDTNSYYRYRNSGINSLNMSIIDNSSLGQLYLIILAIIFLPLAVAITLYFFLKKKKKKKEVKKEDRRKYTDMLTSLKNRNYLNLKINEWEENKILPQTIVVIDLNNVKYVNDNYGHAEGDNLIVKAASILVNTQLENSEIIRTDGNEFLIYLVGYSEQQSETYTQKLAKELKELPHEFGAALGYSMIQDEIKTIDDAINEATISMRKNKEEYK